MATPTSSALIAAAADVDLIARAVALGADMGLTRADVETAQARLAAAPVDDTGSTVASVHEYAAARYAEKVAALPPRPGMDPSAVTDAHLRHALRTLTANA